MKRTLALILTLCMVLAVPALAATPEDYKVEGYYTMSLTLPEERTVWDRTAQLVRLSPTTPYIDEIEASPVSVVGKDAVFTVSHDGGEENCEFYVYFQTYTRNPDAEELTYAQWDQESGQDVYKSMKVSDKYTGGKTFWYLTEKDPGEAGRPAGDGLYWTEAQRIPLPGNGDVEADTRLLRPGESVSVTVPDLGGDTVYLLWAVKHYPEKDYYPGIYEYFVMDDDYLKEHPAEYVGAFRDVRTDDYFAEAVSWALEKEVTTGTTAETFTPWGECTRGQVVTFLWRAQGCPEPESAENPFSDVSAESPFYRAILWAAEKKITGGFSDGTFRPGEPCTRAQIVTFLWRAQGEPQPAGESALAARYAQSAYYRTAVAWADAMGALEGTFYPFAPAARCPRADTVTYLCRVLNG